MNIPFPFSAKSIVASALLVLLVGCSDSDPGPSNFAGRLVLSGTAAVGETLTATPFEGDGLPASITYSWAADGVTIAGATDNTYLLTAAEVGALITASASYTDNEGNAESPTSEALGPVVGDTTNTNTVGMLAITGTATVGETLTATVTDADGATGAITYQWAADGVAIAGATAMTFVLTDAQFDQVITATAMFTDDGGFDEDLMAAATANVAGVNDGAAVAITGTPTVGETLTATVTDADGVTGTIAYQWAADGIDIAGATAQTYVLTMAEVGAVMTVTAVYTDDQNFAEDVTSAGTAPVAPMLMNMAGLVTISGVVEVGGMLMAAVTDANGLTTSTIVYQWASAGVAIAGANAMVYSPTASDVGNMLSVTAMYMDDDGFMEMVTSAATVAVPAVTTDTVGIATIAGLAQVGETLTAMLSDANGVTTSTPTYQWSANGAAIAGATAATYSPVDADVGATITVTIDYTDDQGFAGSVTSAPTAAVEAAPTNTVGAVTITGTAQVAETLTAAVTDANGTTTSTITYQWAADGVAIGGATATTYELTAAEIGAIITVTADYTDDDGFVESLTSAGTVAVVTNATNTVGTVTITGTAQVAETLTANVADTNGTTGSTITYQWAADSVDIGGATATTYVLTAAEIGAIITVTADYTDDDGFVESITSAGTAAVLTNVTNTMGSVAVTGTTLVGDTLTAAVTDANGTGTINYQWKADDVDIAAATASTYVLTTAQLGTTVSVTVDYTDNEGFAEGPLDAAAGDLVYSAIVTGETTLMTAVMAAADGDVIGLDSAGGGDDYADMGEVDFAANLLQVRRTAGSTAVITGATCIVFSGDGIVADGLVFDDLDWIMGTTCDSNGDGSVYLSGDGVTLRNSEFLGEAEPRTVPSGDAYHYITLKGFGNIIERNLFQDKDMDNEGSIISIFADTNIGSNEGHIIRYNLFKDIPGKTGVSGNRNSTAHALQIGRSTGGDSVGTGDHTVQYNRFENVESERRLMRVQSGGNLIEGNTVVNSLGLIALEDGFASTVRENVILSGGEDNDDGGISFAPLGHTITDNYINNMRTTSGQRAALLINPDPLSGSGNTTILGTGGLDFTLTVARNTVVNARQALSFDDPDCGDLDPILDFDDNFIMNQSSGLSINMNTNGVNRFAVTDEDWDNSGCVIDGASDFDNNHFYSATLAEGSFNFNGAAADNVVGGEDGATFVVDPVTGLVDGSGVDAGVGADTSLLNVIAEDQVGPGSTWVAP
ncbi:MAG: chondroitinase-B domain-containing protein [Gammaproteobacteria bacterium]